MPGISFTHDQPRARAYHWGEDGLAGISDHKQRLCFALALWSGKGPILMERRFGTTNSEGNHGEDVTEYYFSLDSTPTHSYQINDNLSLTTGYMATVNDSQPIDLRTDGFRLSLTYDRHKIVEGQKRLNSEE